MISKYSPGSSEHPFLYHRFYTTVNMVHTIEALLGMPAMNQNDAYAPVLAALSSGPGDQQSFSADWSNRDNGLIYQINPVNGQGARESARMDFTHPDAADPVALNAILWRDRKGNLAMPAPKHTVLEQQVTSTDARPMIYAAGTHRTGSRIAPGDRRVRAAARLRDDHSPCDECDQAR